MVGEKKRRNGRTGGTERIEGRAGRNKIRKKGMRKIMEKEESERGTDR